MSGWANHSPGDPWGDLREGRRREVARLREFMAAEGIPVDHLSDEELAKAYVAAVEEHVEPRPDPDQNVSEPSPDGA